METRSRFRDLPDVANVVGQFRWEKRPVGRGRRPSGRDPSPRGGGIVALPGLQKSTTGALGSPYPKPTQVGEARSLRRASHLSLRNSAKCPRTFGRRGPGPVSGRGHTRDPSDCLPKTQVPAKS